MIPKLVQKNLDKVWIGMVFSLILTTLSLGALYLFNEQTFKTFDSFIHYMRVARMFSAIISLSAIPNLLLFFIFIWTKRYRSARGVLTIVMLITLLVAYLKFS